MTTDLAIDVLLTGIFHPVYHVRRVKFQARSSMSARKRPIFKSQPVTKTSLPSYTTLSRQKALFIPSGQLHSIVPTDRHKVSTLLPRALQRLEKMSRSPNFHLFPWAMYSSPRVRFDGCREPPDLRGKTGWLCSGAFSSFIGNCTSVALGVRDLSEVCLRKVFTAIEGRYKKLSFAM